MEHRWYQREKTNFIVSIYQNGEFIAVGRVTNISQEGMFIELPKNHGLTTDDTISIGASSSDHDNKINHLHAIIIHEQPYGVGVMTHSAGAYMKQTMLKQAAE